MWFLKVRIKNPNLIGLTGGEMRDVFEKKQAGARQL